MTARARWSALRAMSGHMSHVPVIQVVAAHQRQMIHQHGLRVQHAALVSEARANQTKAKGAGNRAFVIKNTTGIQYQSMHARENPGASVEQPIRITRRDLDDRNNKQPPASCGAANPTKSARKRTLTHGMTGTSLTLGMSTRTSTPRAAASERARTREPLGTT